MKKIGIFTLNGYDNYGNRLQNYALQNTIENFGFTTETILIDRSGKKQSISYKIKKVLFILPILRKIYKEFNSKYYKVRYMNFFKFSMEYLKESRIVYSNENFSTFDESKYSYFIVGSDQVWNPHFLHGTDFYFLSFTAQNKRINYAPSFGIDYIPKELKAKYSEWINGFNYLSVREESGKKIIKELTGRDALVLIDPTLLISKEEWTMIAKSDKQKPESPFILSYFLGKADSETKKKINKLSKLYKMKIVNLADIRYKKFFSVGPSEFIDYIKSCSILFTDSFHGAVFSILFERPFVIFKRENMNSRIDTLLSMFKLEERKWASIRITENYFNINYSHVLNILSNEREKSINYLKIALDEE